MKHDTLLYCFGVIWNNHQRFTEWEWEYYHGDYEASPHGIHNSFWRTAMDMFIALSED